MARAVVEEYQELARDMMGNVMLVPGRLITSQDVTYTSSTATANAFNKLTSYVFIQTEATMAWVKFGASPTADAADGNQLIPAGGGRFFKVDPNQSLKVALYDGAT